ncbi:MAG: hypothetical protein ACYDCN_08710, partial [Bacteroidia bacterium]
ANYLLFLLRKNKISSLRQRPQGVHFGSLKNISSVNAAKPSGARCGAIKQPLYKQGLCFN